MATRRPSFFKVLIGDHFSDKLKIPGAFLSHFDGAEVPARCQLRIGTQTWVVDVEMVHHKFYFQNGWKEFVHENGLKGCEFLVFFYNGNSEFCVDIYGKDACKREFTGVAREVSDSSKWKSAGSSREMEEFDSVDTSFEADDDDDDDFESEADSKTEDEYEYEDEEEEVESDGDEGKSDDSIEILDEFPRWSKANPMRKSSGFDNRMINRSKAKEKSSMMRASGSSSIQTITGRLKPVGIGELIARQRASGFISKTVKPCCAIVMSPSSVHGSFLHFPSNFANRHLKKHCSHITLQVNNRSRCLSLYHAKESVRLQAGWANFVHENSLKQGDVCVFVLTDKVQYVFDVTIFRATEASNSTFPGGRKTTGVQFKGKKLKSKAG